MVSASDSFRVKRWSTAGKCCMCEWSVWCNILCNLLHTVWTTQSTHTHSICICKKQHIHLNVRIMDVTNMSTVVLNTTINKGCLILFHIFCRSVCLIIQLDWVLSHSTHLQLVTCAHVQHLYCSFTLSWYSESSVFLRNLRAQVDLIFVCLVHMILTSLFLDFVLLPGSFLLCGSTCSACCSSIADGIQTIFVCLFVECVFTSWSDPDDVINHMFVYQPKQDKWTGKENSEAEYVFTLSRSLLQSWQKSRRHHVK